MLDPVSTLGTLIPVRPLDRGEDRTDVLTIADDLVIHALADPILPGRLVGRDLLLEPIEHEARERGAQALHGERSGTESLEHHAHLVAHLGILQGRGQRARRRELVETQPDGLVAQRLRAITGRVVECEVVARKHAPGAAPDGRYRPVDDEAADVVRRIEPLDRVSDHAIDVGAQQGLGQLLDQAHEHADASLEEQSIQGLVRIAAVDRARGGAYGRQQRGRGGHS